MRTDFYYPSCGAGLIHGCRWDPVGEPAAVLQIVHGVAERVERYDEFANFLTERGILVVAADHMGHGGSLGESGKLGHFTGGWHKAVADVHRLLADIRTQYPAVPYILLGHSMGSFMVRTLLCKYPECGISAAIISGTAWMPGAVVGAGIAAAKLVGRRQDPDQPSKFLNELMFGSYNNRVEHHRTSHDWLTRDQKIVDQYIADPLCGFTMTPGLAKDMLTGIQYIQQTKHLANMRKDLPVLFIAGSDDPVGGYGKGVKQAAQAFEKAGMEQVSVRLYPLCRHEVLNELNRKDIYADVMHWLQKRGLYA